MPNSGGIPEKIKLGDVEYVVKDHPELLKVIENARKEEKTKLYSQISSLDAKVKVLEDEKKTSGELSSTKEEKLKKLQDELAVVKAEKEKLEGDGKGGSGNPDDGDDGKGDDGKGKATKPTFSKKEAEQMVKEALAKQNETFEGKLAEVRGGLTQKTVSDYRKEQLAKHKGLIIEQLVPDGLDSEEAVNKAIQTALETSKGYIAKEYDIDGKKQKMTIAEYEEYETKQQGAGDDGNGGKGTGDYVPPTPPGKPDGGSGDLTGKELLSKIEDMSDEEYAKHHEAIKKEAKTVKYQDQ